MKVGFELTGKTALLMHNDDVEASDMLDEWRKDPKNKGVSKAGDDRSPAWTWQTYLYHDGEHLALPQSNLMVCLRAAATKMILKGNKTYKEVSQSGMAIYDEYVEFRAGGKQVATSDVQAIWGDEFKSQSDAVREMGFRLFVKRARVGQSKHVRVRPRFDSWSVRGELLVDAEELKFSILEQMFGIAGRVGLCDWRPGCKTPGPFGMFEARLEKLSD